jgi:hypothetical protein
VLLGPIGQMADRAFDSFAVGFAKAVGQQTALSLKSFLCTFCGSLCAMLPLASQMR